MRVILREKLCFSSTSLQVLDSFTVGHKLDWILNPSSFLQSGSYAPNCVSVFLPPLWLGITENENCPFPEAVQTEGEPSSEEPERNHSSLCLDKFSRQLLWSHPGVTRVLWAAHQESVTGSALPALTLSVCLSVWRGFKTDIQKPSHWQYPEVGFWVCNFL